MGTRADFYYEDSKKKLHWLGSIGWDGYPGGIDYMILMANTAKMFKSEVSNFLSKRDDATLPIDGWPWPWETSKTTDYAYVFRRGVVYASNFGSPLFNAKDFRISCDQQTALIDAARIMRSNPEIVEALEEKKRLLMAEDEAAELNGPAIKFPDMTAIQNISHGANSGLIVIRGAK